jgi:hypothetical protein
MPDSPKVFFLYLRSFLSDSRTTETWSLIDNKGRVVDTPQGSPKAALEILLQPAGPLIELGGEQHLGVGQIRIADENWWDSAVRLIIHSTANFLCPGTTRSLAREAEFILAHKKLRRRSFLIMEPSHETMLSAASEKDKIAAADRKVRWNQIANFFRSHHVDLPDYDGAGAIVSLSAPNRWQKFAGIRRYQLYDLLQETYVDLRKRGSYDLTLHEPCPCKSGLTYGECHAPD